MDGKIQLLQTRWENLWQTAEHYPLENNIRFVSRIGFLGLLYFYLNFTIVRTTVIPFESYQSPVIVWEFFLSLFSNFKNILWLPLLFTFGFFWRRLNTPWQVFSHFKAIRIITVAAAGILAWVFATYDFNLYYNQPHYLVRILLLIFIPLIWKRPVFILPFVLILLPVLNQFKILNLYPVANFLLPIHILTMVFAYFLFYVITKSRHISDFVFLFGCMYFAHYWWSGWNKITEEWIFHDQISHLTSVMYANGWLGFLSTASLETFIETISPLNTPLRLFVLSIELGCIFFLVHRKSARFFLIGFILFHIGAFIMYGICFWVWVLLDLVFLVLLWRKDGFSEHFNFNKFQILLSVVLIFFCYRWNTLTALSWHTSPLGYTYHFEATTEDGNVHHLPPQFFAPWDFQFTMTNFKYLQKEPRFYIFWGATGDKTAELLRKGFEPEQFSEFEEANGTVHYDEEQVLFFDRFMSTFIKNWNARLSNKTALSVIRAPEHVWTFPRKAFNGNPQKIDNVTVTEITTLYRDGKHLELRRIPVYEITNLLKKE